MSSRELSTALQDARSVTLAEYAGRTTISQKIASPDEIAQLRKATGIWFYDLKPVGALCFEPHHRAEIVRADGSQLHFAVCFHCGNFLVTKEPFHEGDTFLYGPLPSAWEKSLTTFFGSVGMTPKTDEQYTDIELAEPNADATTAKTKP
jgi:hypothetical protein